MRLLARFSRRRTAFALGPRQQGQSLVEFALVIPIFMLLLGGIIQFAVILWGQNTLNQVVRDAGRYAATVPDCSPASHADAVAHTTAVAQNSSLAGSLGNITVALPTNGEMIGNPPVADPVSKKSGAATANYCPPADNGDEVWVRVTVEARMPLFFPWIPGNGDISSTALFRMEPVAP
jgi:Flp pilus assembly protein TadG